MICSVRFNDTLDFDHHLTDGASTGQTVVRIADFFEAKWRFIKQWFNCARIYNLGSIRISPRLLADAMT